MRRDEGGLSSLGGREHAGRLVESTLTEALDTAHQEQEQRGGGLDFRAQRALRSIEPLAAFGDPTLGDVDRRHGRQRHARDRFGLPAVALGDRDRLGRDRPLPGQRPSRQEGDVGEAADLEVRPSGSTRELEGVLEVAFGLVRATRPQLDDAEVHQGRRARVVPEEHPVEGAGCRLEERADLGEHGLVIAATAREGEPGDGEVEPETCPPVGWNVLAMLLRQRDVRRRRPERMGRELLVGHERRELGLASSIRRQGREEAVDRRSLPVERERQAVLCEEAARVVPRLGSLGVADRLEHVAMGDVPLGGGEMKLGDVLGARAAELQPQEIGQQMVVAEGRPRRIDRDDEDVLVLEREKDPFGPGGAEEVVCQRPGDVVEDRRPKEQATDVRGLAGEHLGEQVVGHGPLIARELGDEAARIRMTRQRERGQTEPGCPALGPAMELRQAVVVEPDARRLQKLAASRRGQLQIGLANLGELAGEAESVEPELRVVARRQDDAELRGPPGDELREWSLAGAARSSWTSSMTRRTGRSRPASSAIRRCTRA